MKILDFFSLIKNNLYITKIDLNEMPIFKQIEIETVNRCNGKCSFCPVNINQPQRVYAKMTDELFKKIITNLAEINYKGDLCLSSNNEPFLDSRMPQFIKYASEMLHDASIYLWTNGSVITSEQLESIMGYLNKIYIDSYSNNNELTENVKRLISGLCKDGYSDDIDVISGLTGLPSQKKIVVLNRDINEVLSSRGGQAPNKNNSYNIFRIKHSKCKRVFECMVIRPTGKLSLCCCDALGLYEMGDVNTDRIEKIWKNSQEYRRVRKHMQKKGRKGLKLCEDCDF